MTEAMPFLQKYDITFLRPPTICPGIFGFENLIYFVTVHVPFAFAVTVQPLPKTAAVAQNAQLRGLEENILPAAMPPRIQEPGTKGRQRAQNLHALCLPLRPKAERT